MIEKKAEYSTAIHPFQGGTFQITGDSAYYSVDLVWPSKRVLLFSSENTEEYELAKTCGWTCFVLSDESVTWEKIVEAIKE